MHCPRTSFVLSKHTFNGQMRSFARPMLGRFLIFQNNAFLQTAINRVPAPTTSKKFAAKSNATANWRWNVLKHHNYSRSHNYARFEQSVTSDEKRARSKRPLKRLVCCSLNRWSNATLMKGKIEKKRRKNQLHDLCQRLISYKSPRCW